MKDIQASPKPTEISSSIKNAINCLDTIAQKVLQGTAQLPDGTNAAALLVEWGPYPVTVTDLGKRLRVMATIQVDEDVRKKWQKITPSTETNAKAKTALMETLTTSPRTGYSIIPNSYTKMCELENIILTQNIVMESGDPSTCNRLIDAVQEIATTIAKVFNFLTLTGEPSGSTSTTSISSSNYWFFGESTNNVRATDNRK